MIKNESLKKSIDELDIVDARTGETLLNIRVANSSRLQRAHLSLKAEQSNIIIQRRRIIQDTANKTGH